MYRLIAAAVLIIGLIGGIAYKYHSMSSTIDNLNRVIVLNNKTMTNLKLKVALREANINKLTNSIRVANEVVTGLQVKNNQTVKEYQQYKKQPKPVKYKYIYKYIYPTTKTVADNNISDVNSTVDYSKPDCKAGLYLNKVISGLKYETFYK